MVAFVDRASAVLRLSLFALPILIGCAQVADAAGAAVCDGISRAALLGTEPFQVNPGARCAMNVEFQTRKFCVYARQVGRPKRLGPFCNKGEEMVEMPRGIEWMWSADNPVNVYIMLTPGTR